MSTLDTGAIATTPRSTRSPSYDGASCPPNSAPWPPWEWPSSTYCVVRAVSRRRAAFTLSIIERAALPPIRYGWAASVPRPGIVGGGDGPALAQHGRDGRAGLRPEDRLVRRGRALVGQAGGAVSPHDGLVSFAGLGGEDEAGGGDVASGDVGGHVVDAPCGGQRGQLGRQGRRRVEQNGAGRDGRGGGGAGEENAGQQAARRQWTAKGHASWRTPFQGHGKARCECKELERGMRCRQAK